MNQLYSFGPLAMISLCTSSANPLYMALSDLYEISVDIFKIFCAFVLVLNKVKSVDCSVACAVGLFGLSSQYYVLNN